MCNSHKNVAHLRGLEKVYHADDEAPPVRALDGVDLDIPEGQHLAIMGPSGSGKSTLMNILGCLDRPTAGTYFLGGRDVAKLDDRELSSVRGKHLGFIFQAFNLIPQLTVEGNIEVPLFYQGVPRRERRQRARAAIERVGLTERIDHRPSELSGGQQQRVATARALVNEPSILLADEPTGNLDSATGKAILDLLDELHDQGLTIIVVTHDDHVAERCQRCIRLLDGKIESDEHVRAKDK